MITKTQYLEARKLIRVYQEQQKQSVRILNQQYRDKENASDVKTIQFSKLAEEKGYKYGVCIKSEDFPNMEFKIVFGMIWSEEQKALVVGCKNEQNNLYHAVQIYKPESNWWAEIIDKK